MEKVETNYKNGYCLYKESFNRYKIISTWMIVFFYSVIITLLFKIIPFFDRFYTVRFIDFVKAFIPISSYQYWYFTAYVLLFLFAPLLNSAIQNVSNQILLQIFIFIFLFVSVISSIFPQDLFNINKGYSSLWLINLYLIGAFIKKIDNKEYLPKNILLFSLFICLFYILVVFSNKNTLINRFQKQILMYNNPLCFIASLYFFKIFKDINITNAQINKGINIIGASSFSVYLIHAHPLIFRYIISGNCKNISLYLLLPFSLFIFLLCIVIDLLRKKCFNFLKISKLSIFIQEFLESCMSKFSKIKDK